MFHLETHAVHSPLQYDQLVPAETSKAYVCQKLKEENKSLSYIKELKLKYVSAQKKAWRANLVQPNISMFTSGMDTITG